MWLIVAFALILLKVVVIVTIVSLSVIVQVFSSSGWAFFAFSAAILSICTNCWHAADIYRLIKYPEAIGAPFNARQLVPGVVQITYHIVLVVTGPAFWAQAFTLGTVGPYWAALPAFLVPFILFDLLTTILIVIRRKKGADNTWAGRVICPFVLRHSKIDPESIAVSNKPAITNPFKEAGQAEEEIRFERPVFH